MSGDLKRASGEMNVSFPSGPPSLGSVVGRKMANGRQSPTSPLKLFGHAKKKINDIFVEITTYIDEGNAFLKGKKTFMNSLVAWTFVGLLGFCHLVENSNFFL